VDLHFANRSIPEERKMDAIPMFLAREAAQYYFNLRE
jgi:hypothetical protein